MRLRQERPTQFIAAYHLRIARPGFAQPPDKTIDTGSHVSTYRNIGDAQLTTIHHKELNIDERYIRFFGLASGIPPEELEMLNFPDPEYMRHDLVVACPFRWMHPNKFRLVSEEVGHDYTPEEVKVASHERTWLPSPEEYGQIINDVRRPGVYMSLPEPLGVELNIRDDVPMTVEACLSVGGLFMVRDAETIMAAGA